MMTELITSIVVRAQNGYYRLRDEEQAQTLTEYALIIAVIALGVLVALYFLKDNIKSLFSKTGSTLSTQPS
jgi:Flp pilus assembly pilin Flp